MPARASLRFLNVSELAEVSGLAAATVSSRLNAAGLAPARVRGKIKLFDAPQALRLLLAGEDLDAKRERARLDAVRADLGELDLATKRGELLEALDVEALGAAIVSGVAMRVMSIRNLAPEVRGAGTDAEGAEILEDGAREALSEIARMGEIVGEVHGAQRSNAASVDGGREAAAEADGERVGGHGAEAIA